VKTKWAWAIGGLCIVGAGALILPQVNNRIGMAEAAAAQSDEATMATLIREFKHDCGRCPTTEEGFKALTSCPPGLNRSWNGPYTTKPFPNDPWANPYLYWSDGKRFKITSYGSDGQPGGDGDAADIVDTE